MIVSGAISAVAGVSFVAGSTQDVARLTGLAGMVTGGYGSARATGSYGEGRSVPASFPASSAASPKAAEAPAPRVGLALAEDPPLPGESTEGWYGLGPDPGAGGGHDQHQHHQHHGHGGAPAQPVKAPAQPAKAPDQQHQQHQHHGHGGAPAQPAKAPEGGHVH